MRHATQAARWLWNWTPIATWWAIVVILWDALPWIILTALTVLAVILTGWVVAAVVVIIVLLVQINRKLR